MGLINWIQRLFAGEAKSAPAVAKPPPPDAFGLLFGGTAPALAAPHLAGRSRETIFIAGNCFANSMVTIFGGIPALNQRFEFERVATEGGAVLDADQRARLAKAGRILAQDIAEVEAVNLQSLVASGCDIIRFPHISFRSLWPWNWRQVPPSEQRADAAVLSRYRDSGIEALQKKFDDPEALLAAYRTPGPKLQREFEHLIDFDQRALLGQDEKYGLKTGQFILNNFMRKNLFHSPAHPKAEVFEQVCIYVWQKLNFPGRLEPGIIPEQWRLSGLPIHPAVVRHFRLDWADEQTRYACGQLGELTWEEYMRAYLEVFAKKPA